MFKKVLTRKVYVEIVKQVQDLIEDGKLKCGDKLPSERILIEELGVSRPPLREAMCALEILGVIRSRGGKGNFIRSEFSSASYAKRLKGLEKEKSPFELLEARKAVETEIAALAAERATSEDIKEIEEVLDGMRNSLNNASWPKEYDIQFHVAVARAAHNSVLFEMMNHLADGLKESLWVNIKEKSWSLAGHPQKYLEKHTKLLQAIKKGDKNCARRAMYNHLVDIEEDLLE